MTELERFLLTEAPAGAKYFGVVPELLNQAHVLAAPHRGGHIPHVPMQSGSGYWSCQPTLNEPYCREGGTRQRSRRD
jgi:hypothetical protein